MNAKVQEFIQQQNEEYEARKKAEYEKAKADILKQIGLVEKEYSPDGVYTVEYNKYEYDENNKCSYYREVPINISDEDFEALKNCLAETGKEKMEIQVEAQNKKGNRIANILWVFAWIIYIGGFFAGLALGTDYRGNLSGYVIVYWVVFFVTGTLYASIAEIINLLHDIRNRMR